MFENALFLVHDVLTFPDHGLTFLVFIFYTIVATAVVFVYPAVILVDPVMLTVDPGTSCMTLR